MPTAGATARPASRAVFTNPGKEVATLATLRISIGARALSAAIVNATHSGLGGTGDVMILTAAERMELFPFAQVATRIGGAITVTLALIALSRIGMQ